MFGMYSQKIFPENHRLTLTLEWEKFGGKIPAMVVPGKKSNLEIGNRMMSSKATKNTSQLESGFCRIANELNCSRNKFQKISSK